MAEREVILLCYWNGCIKYGPDGLYYEGSTPKKISVKQNTELSRLLDGLYLITGLDRQRSKLDIIGRYPVAVSPNLIRYVHLPVVNKSSLESMLQVPNNHPSISVELYLEVKSTSDDVIVPPAACSSPLANPGSSSSKRQRTHEANGYADTDVTNPVVKLEREDELEVQGVDNNNGLVEDEANPDLGSDEVAQAVNLTGDNGNAHMDSNVPGLEASENEFLNNGVGSSASKPQVLSSLWVDDHELRVGLCFKDRDELKKAVDWCSIRGQKQCVVQETSKDEYLFKCIRWKCKWSVWAARIEEDRLFEITKYTGPHTCCPVVLSNFNSVFAAEEIESLIRVQPTLRIPELKNWWFEKFGYEVGTAEMQAAKHEAIKNIYGDWDQSFRVLPKLMAAFHSSNGLVVDWQYDVFPNPEFASFRGVFWAFSQSIEGFPHCRPVIVVDTKDIVNGKYPMTMMVASGIDAADCYFPLAFAVTKEVSSDSWRWFLTNIREKVTQREGLCLISSPHQDILAVINEPGSLCQEPWAYHRFCLDRLSSQFYDVFHNLPLKELMKQAGSTKQQDEFDSHMETIKKQNAEARRWLDQIPPHQWALAHDNGRRYGVMTVNAEILPSVCQSFWRLGLPVTAATLVLFDGLRLYFEMGLSKSRCRLNRGDVYTKPVRNKLEEFRTASVTYVVMPLDNNAFQVTTPLQKNGWIVQLSECTCTCGMFQSKKFPCQHALGVCEKLKINPLLYVNDCYTAERYYKTYAATFSPVPEVSAWPEASGVPTLFPPFIPPPPPTNVSGKSKQKTTPPTVQKKR